MPARLISVVRVVARNAITTASTPSYPQLSTARGSDVRRANCCDQGATISSFHSTWLWTNRHKPRQQKTRGHLTQVASSFDFLRIMAPQVGLEPTTFRLTEVTSSCHSVARSSIQLVMFQ